MEAARHFPALYSDDDWVFLENAGGTAVPQQVIDSTARFLATANWQLGAGYPGSQSTEAVVASARTFINALASRTPDGAEAAGFAALGASTTALLAMIGRAIEPTLLHPGDVLIVSAAGHESNIGPWVRAAQRSGATLLWWLPSADGRDTCPLDGLRELIASACGPVRLVAFPHASNLLGGIVDVASVASLARQAGALTFCDGVALAPHRRVDSTRLGVDFYAVSLYKVFGPHLGYLYGTQEAWTTLHGLGCETPNHCFIGQPGGSRHPACWEPGGVNPASCAGVCGLRQYFEELTQQQHLDDAALVDAAFDAVEAGEHGALTELATFFTEQHEMGTLRLLGPLSCDPSIRVPTFSFVPLTPGTTPASVVDACHAAQVACRRGSMYAPRLCEHLGIEEVVRISAVHYNTVEDARRCVKAIRGALCPP
jgi:selenocysteine lyase/cysteine desulfurase